VIRLLAGGLDTESRKYEEIFIFSQKSRRPAGVNTTSYSVETCVISVGVKRPEHDAHSHPFSEDIKNEWSHTSTPAIRLRGVGRDNSACTSAL
jgi:hypothetical protein